MYNKAILSCLTKSKDIFNCFKKIEELSNIKLDSSSIYKQIKKLSNHNLTNFDNITSATLTNNS
jgi:hypothetical protein